MKYNNFLFPKTIEINKALKFKVKLDCDAGSFVLEQKD
jgi:hypothetical protein